MIASTRVRAGCMLLAALMAAGPNVALAASKDASLREIRREIKKLEVDRTRDLELIQKLEKKVDQLEGENAQLKTTTTQVKTEQAQTTADVKQIKAQAEMGPSGAQFSDAFGRYLGSHTFSVSGAAAFNFAYDQQSSPIDGIHRGTQNAFTFDWEPLILYRPTDWLSFVGVMSGSFGQTGTGTDLSTAEFLLTLNDYATLVGGLFDQPFGDWYETQSPMWVNRFITAPLPFGVEAVTPAGEVGLQARGGFEWGKMGQDADYTLWVGTGPSFSEPVKGAVVGAPTAIANKDTNGKGFGARFRVYPLPVDAGWGRLELGASTYNGKWMDGLWFTSWGVDFNYFIDNLQTRGEWVESYRDMPAGIGRDNRQGWYLQIGYFLNGVKIPGLPDEINNYVQKLEPLIRYSGVNQHEVAIDDITAATGIGVGGIQAGLIPDFGLSGSPSLWAPHSREVALGLDYWVTPSIVWQNEFDIELPHAGGMFVDSTGTGTPVGGTPNDHAFLSQFTVGF